ncbi:MAG: diphosphate--fructose-6-phosphate 1-phosphotransferase, partial [Eubacteriales bacterium]|nr:diphosphate--fructose-6-phosphate 1-phosphotransferase [Eubacteriales bacterium]
MYNNALYIQSGGPTAVINASACGVIRACREHSSQIHTLYASIHGVRGLIDNHLIDLKNFTEKRLVRFRRTPGMAFGSCRYKVNESPESDDYERICQTIREHQIGFIFLNGGNGSAAAALRLSDALERNGIPCKLIVIPKTVDNDILGIDHAPGYPSAARHVALTVAELSHDLVTFDKDLIMVVEVMGRNTGFLAAAALASGTIGRAPDLIYVPEKPFDADTFVKDVQAIMHERGKCLAVVSEGIRDSEGRYLFEHFSLNAGADPSRNMGGVSLYLGNLLREHFPCKIRCIDLNLMQRCSGHDAVELDR